MGKRKSSDIDTYSTLPQTPLHYSVKRLSLECMKALLERGADVTARTVRSKREYVK